MPEQFGPYKWTPKRVIKEMKKGHDVGPSVIDTIPLQRQLEWEEIRRGVIDKVLNKKRRKNENSLWSEIG